MSDSGAIKDQQNFKDDMTFRKKINNDKVMLIIIVY